MIRVLALLSFAVLSACASTGQSLRTGDDGRLPAMRVFTKSAASAPARANARIARDFLDLAFRLENGTRLPVLSRFDGPVTVAVNGPEPRHLTRDLDRLLARLRTEARIDIRRVPSRRNASIIVNLVPKTQIQSAVPNASCFVRPNVADWGDFLRRRNQAGTNWHSLQSRTRMAVFLPVGASPQETRDCLHEEIAQALGPVNDLYRLTDSIFNDANLNGVLTGFDMLILRTHYDQALSNGMTETEVARRLPGILARLNPRGGRQGIAAPRPSNARWKSEIRLTISPKATRERRRLAAERAVLLARSQGLSTSTLAFSYYRLGRLGAVSNPDQAINSFLAARSLYDRIPGARLQSAHVALQLAVNALSGGRPDRALFYVSESIGAARAGEDARLLSRLLFVRAEALLLKDEVDAADKARTEALAWARYGFGSPDEVRKRAAEISAISPRSRQSGGRV